MSESEFTSDLIKKFQLRHYQLGLTQPDVDQKIGVATGLCAKWEMGNRKPTLFNAYCGQKPLDVD